MPERFDQPGETQAFFLARRSPDGVSPIDTGWYLDALERMKDMPRHSTALGQVLPSRPGSPRDSTWSWLGPGNIGGRTRALVVVPSNPNVLYAGAVGGGVWKTTNGGASWTPLTDFLANIAIASLAIDPSNSNVLYAGTGEGFFNSDAIRGAGIFKTTDGGATWAQLAATANSNFYYVNRLAISPNKPSESMPRPGPASSARRTAAPRGARSIRAIIAGGCTDLQIRTDQSNDYLFASEGNEVQGSLLRNTDAGGGGAWSVVFTEAGMGRASIAIAPSNQAVVYALTAESRIRRLP